MKKLIMTILSLLCLHQIVYAKDCNNDGNEAFNEAYNMLSDARIGKDTQLSMNPSFLFDLKKFQQKYCDPIFHQDVSISLDSLVKNAAKELISSIKGN